jgi:hypothetical protein
MRKKCTTKNVTKVLETLTEYIENECDESKKVFAESFDEFLDDLVSNDYFGTEGQSDPRGDQRDRYKF